MHRQPLVRPTLACSTRPPAGVESPSPSQPRAIWRAETLLFVMTAVHAPKSTALLCNLPKPAAMQCYGQTKSTPAREPCTSLYLEKLGGVAYSTMQNTFFLRVKQHVGRFNLLQALSPACSMTNLHPPIFPTLQDKVGSMSRVLSRHFILWWRIRNNKDHTLQDQVTNTHS
ncbi:hypothetical protein HBH70_170200 [Parastagonospora nodorum]|nr:hypothetical protein HBH49_100670 [Parastagonospora nodorum]KAH4083568.1 hypothetical protein HBH46_217240 [Parastagonospora nodorum]KAH4206703.1 hypothetical protein HBI95_119410 [Parastagonospora nodorum]KAH4253637.1 hypothetical protein HBI03_192320 [Parastagonospora nodorum]KAH4254485.1 hypothetical protein HBI04_237180 [Parastagonospora nodorum]